MLENDSTDIDLPQAGTIAVIKTGIVNSSVVLPADVINAGDQITYSFTVTNTGAVTLHNVTVSDQLVTVLGGPLSSLAPGASNSTTFTGIYTLVQSDLDAGHFANQATATGTYTDSDGMPHTASDLSDNNSMLENDSTDIDLPQVPSWTLTKTSKFIWNSS